MTPWERFMLTITFIYTVTEMLAGTAVLVVLLWEMLS